MDTETMNNNDNFDQYHQHEHKHRFWHWIWKLLILVIVFALGYALGSFKTYLRYRIFGDGYNRGPIYMMQGQTTPDNQGFFHMMWPWNKNNPPSNGTTSDASGNDYYGSMMGNEQHASGTITQVSGTKITIADNGGKTQTIVSNSNTQIYSGSSPVGLSALKYGEFIDAWGNTDSSGQWVADEIDINQ